MARYECFSRTQDGAMLLPLATKALESEGFKLRSALGESVSLIDMKPSKRLRDRVVVVLDQNRSGDGRADLQCVVSNEAIAGSGNNRCLDTFKQLVNLFTALPGVEVDSPMALA